MATIRAADGLSLHYEEHGQGEPVVILGGIMMSAASWAQHLPVLSQHMRVILIDLRDQGRSDRALEPYLLDAHVPDVCQLLDELGLVTAHVLGLSYGGQVAQRLALSHPDRLRTLVLANVNHYISNHLAEIGRAWEVAAEINDGERFFQLAVPFIYSPDFYAEYLDVLRERQAMFKTMLTKEWFQGFVRLCRSTEGFRVPVEDLRRISMPTLLLGADEDIITPVRLMETMYREIPNCEFLTIPFSGHGAFLERAGEFLSIVLGFWAKHEKLRGT